MLKECKHHGVTEHVFESNKYARCKKCRTEAVRKRRKKVKNLLVEYKGGKCEVCGYNKCVDALEFHHSNPEEKEFGIAYKGNTISLEKMKKEVDKCRLLCANCHREEHYESMLKKYQISSE